MIQKANQIIEIENWTKEDGTHRYCQKRIWNKRKKQAMVITINPGSADVVETDLTTLLIQNHAFNLGYGGVVLVNLFSKVFSSKPTTLAMVGGTDDTTDSVIEKLIEETSTGTVIVATGTIVEKNILARERLLQILDLVPKSKKVEYLVTSEGQLAHPLAPKMRTSWQLSGVDFVDKYKVNVKE